MKKAIIVGGSMAGMLAGNMLVRQGWTVDILERSREGLEGRGAGIVPQRSLLAALGRAGVTVNPNIGIRVTKRLAYDRAGTAFATHEYDQYSTSWSLLYNLLRDAFPMQYFHAGRHVTDILQDGDRAIAITDDGTKFEGDLLIGADGMRSVVRQALFPQIQPRYVGYLAWRGMLEERHATPEFVESCFAALNFSFPKGEELIGYPVAGANGTVDAGGRRFNIMWYRPVPPGAQLQNMFTGTDGVHYETGIPPGLVRPELIKAMKEEAHRVFPPVLADVIERMDGMFVQAIYDLEFRTDGARQGRRHRRCRLRCTAALRRRRLQGGGRCRQPCERTEQQRSHCGGNRRLLRGADRSGKGGRGVGRSPWIVFSDGPHRVSTRRLCSGPAADQP